MSCRKDRLCLLRGTAPIMECPPVTYQIRSPVVDDVTRYVMAGLWQCNLSRDLDIPTSTASVGDERGRAACVFLIEVRLHYSASSATALVESATAD